MINGNTERLRKLKFCSVTIEYAEKFVEISFVCQLSTFFLFLEDTYYQGMGHSYKIVADFKLRRTGLCLLIFEIRIKCGIQSESIFF